MTGFGVKPITKSQSLSQTWQALVWNQLLDHNYLTKHDTLWCETNHKITITEQNMTGFGMKPVTKSQSNITINYNIVMQLNANHPSFWPQFSLTND